MLNSNKIFAHQGVRYQRDALCPAPASGCQLGKDYPQHQQGRVVAAGEEATESAHQEHSLTHL